MINEMIKQGYQIHFKGETLPGTQIGDVKKKLASLFGLGVDKANSMFNGKQIILKKDLDEDTAKKYMHVLQKIGAKTYIYPELPASNQDLESTGRFSVGLKTCPSCKSIQQPSEYCKDCGTKLNTAIAVTKPKLNTPNPRAKNSKPKGAPITKPTGVKAAEIKAPTLRKSHQAVRPNLPRESILSLAAKNTVAFGKKPKSTNNSNQGKPKTLPKKAVVNGSQAVKSPKLHLGTTKPAPAQSKTKARQRITPAPTQHTARPAKQGQTITPVNQGLPVRSESRQNAVATKSHIRPAVPATQKQPMRTQRRPMVRPNQQGVQVRSQNQQMMPVQRAGVPGVPAVSRIASTADLSTDKQLLALENRQPAITAWNKEHEDEIKALQKNALWGINLGLMLLLAVYFVDLLAQSVGIDISSKPYLIALLPFPVGCWFYAISKGYPGAFGAVIGLANVPGVALLTLMPVRYEHESRFEMGRSSLVAIVALGLSAYWAYSQVHELNIKEKFLHDIAQMQKLRSDYPAGIIEADENRFAKVAQRMEKLLVTGPHMIKQSDFRPAEVTDLSNKLFEEFTGFFTWINYQRHLHFIQVGKIPDFLSKPVISELLRTLRGKLDNGLIEADDSRLNQAYNDWILGVPVTAELEAVSQIHFTLNYVHERIQAYVKKHGKMPISFETMGRFKPEVNQFKVESVSLDQNAVLTLITGNNKIGELSNKTIIMTGMVQTKITRKSIRGKMRRIRNHDLEFFRIGGNLSNRYLKEPYSIFSKW